MEYHYYDSLEDVPFHKQEQLKTLGLWNGTMRYDAFRKNPPAVVVSSDKTIVAWGVFMENSIQMYVHPDYRRRGIGTEIYKILAFKFADKWRIGVFVHDLVSAAFYETIVNKLSHQIRNVDIDDVRPD